MPKDFCPCKGRKCQDSLGGRNRCHEYRRSREVLRSTRKEVFYLQGYSPELNPDERLNADLKHAITTGVPKRTRQGLRKKTEEHMTMVASTPEHVKSYFKDKHVRYAADSQ